MMKSTAVAKLSGFILLIYLTSNPRLDEIVEHLHEKFIF